MRRKNCNERPRYIIKLEENIETQNMKIYIFSNLISQEINRRNRRIIKQTFDSDVLEINETPTVIPKKSTSETEKNHLQKKPNLPHAEVKSNANSTTHVKRAGASNEKKAVNDKKTADADEDDWESIFDDNGDCLDPKVMDEITANVGKVTVTKPKNDYKNYQEPINLDGEEFPHVLEVSNFPAEFKTQDLMMIFAEYKDSGYDIKWVDDTHALVVFSSSKVGTYRLKRTIGKTINYLFLQQLLKY